MGPRHDARAGVRLQGHRPLTPALQPGRAVVTGGAGFIGSHLCERLLALGCDVVCVDNYLTSGPGNIAHLRDNPHFELLEETVHNAFDVEGDVDYVFHFASPASPGDYLRFPIETLHVGAYGTEGALILAAAKKARMMLASTSEVYGDPEVHPQPESYWGNVNPIGPRSVYDEAKRVAEAFTMAYHRHEGVDTCIVRIFNTYGPRMRPNDGRAIPNFATQALRGEPITVYGDGSQTRSLCFVDDLVEGIVRLMAAEGVHDPVNLGNEAEMTMLQLAEAVRDAAGSSSEIVFQDLPQDDPRQRRPDLTRARSLLGWEPKVPLAEGLPPTLAWFRSVGGDGSSSAVALPGTPHPTLPPQAGGGPTASSSVGGDGSPSPG